MRVLGMISGTSHDGIDVAVVDFSHHEGVLAGALRYTDSVPYAPDLRARIIAALPPTATDLAEVCALDTLIGQEFAAVAASAVAAAGPVDAVCSHGQTVFHWVEAGQALGTLQLGQPAWIAERVGAPVVADIRARDLTVGGHGAPLASYLDHLLLRGRGGRPGALNLGGISNMTVIGDRVRAFDIGPANALIDAVVTARELHPRGYDEGARIASAGQPVPGLLELLLAEPYYRLAAPKSTGKELFNRDYVERQVHAWGRPVRDADLLATLTELTARTVADAVLDAGLDYLAVSGGGAHNPLLMRRLRELMPQVAVVLSDELGAPADTKEAILMALIGWCTLHGVPAIVPGGTGSDEPRILGSITPGAGPLRLPEPVAAVTGLVLTA